MEIIEDIFISLITLKGPLSLDIKSPFLLKEHSERKLQKKVAS